MAERTHLSIGEVLSLLREEFPDVTISKIRFLESQGLVDPERTPSGYRKFYDHDVERLRWILRQQRENFLPLKVIRGRLSEQEDPGEPSQPAVTSPVGRAPAPRREPAGRGPTPSIFAELRREQPSSGTPQSTPGRDHHEAGAAADGSEGPLPSAAGRGDVEALEPDVYTAEELAVAAASSPSIVEELNQFGLISPQAVVGGVAYYDETALAVTRTASLLGSHGVEVRHLRVWRNAADREADLYQQVVLPLLRQRNPQARRRASETLAELARLGADMRAALVERALREIR